jgi:hypothetical protein
MSGNHKKRFDRIAKDCREARVPFPEKFVKRFERVAKKLNADWGRPAAGEYLNELIFPSRPGRRGFPPEVAAEIVALKNLHEERYKNVFQVVWHQLDQLCCNKSSGGGKTVADLKATPSTIEASIDQTLEKVARTPVGERKYSAVVAQLLPETVRNTLARAKMARKQSGATVTFPAPESEREELLVDAESLLEEEHFNSGTAILEQIATLFPDEYPFAYLRLMEIYQLIGRPEDFDWVNQRLSEQFDCSRLEWTAERQQFRARLDKLAESFLVGMHRQ